MKRTLTALAFAAALPSLALAQTQPPAASTAAVTVQPQKTPQAAPAQPAQPAAAAPAQEGEWHRACDGDVAKFCGGAKDKPAIIACLDKNTASLSAECQRVRRYTEKQWRERHEREHKHGRR